MQRIGVALTAIESTRKKIPLCPSPPSSEATDRTQYTRNRSSFATDPEAGEGHIDMKGHIRERSPGQLGYHSRHTGPRHGQAQKKMALVSGTKKQAHTECSRLITEMSRGAYRRAFQFILATFLDQWLEQVRTQVSPRTYERY